MKNAVLVFTRIRQLSSYIKLKSFDISTIEGRSKERYRRVVLTSIMSIVSKGVAVLTGLISVPLTLHYLGPERFGLWATISSITILLVFSDFGLSNGLLNAISEANGRNDKESARKAVSSIFYLLSGIAILFLVVFGLVYPYVSWSQVYNVSTPQAIQEAGPATFVFFIFFALGLPFGIVQRVQTGYQEGFVNAIWQMVGYIISLLSVILVIYFRAGLPWLVFALYGVPILIMILNWIVLFGWRRSWLWPRLKAFQWNVGRTIAGKGLLFFVLTFFSLLGTSTDNLIIAHILGATAVATYAVVVKFFMVVLIAQFIFQPLWPAFGEALERGDHAWVKRALTRSLLLSVGLGIATGVLMVFISRPLIVIWVGGDVMPPMSLIYGFAVWGLFASTSSVLTSLLNTGPYLLDQIILALFAALVSFGLKIIFTHLFNVSGVIWGTTIGYGLFYVIPGTLLAFHKLKKLNIKSSESF